MKNNTLRWIAASFSISGSVMQAMAIIRLQWVAWILLMISVLLWSYIAYTDKDKARLTQQIVFLFLSALAIYNWFKHSH